MLKKLIAIWSACLLLAMGFTACDKGDTYTLPAPKPVNEEIPDDDDNGGGGGSGGGGGTSGTLCSDIGQTPIILAYYTASLKSCQPGLEPLQRTRVSTPQAFAAFSHSSAASSSEVQKTALTPAALKRYS